jgi:hypothetical protein
MARSMLSFGMTRLGVLDRQAQARVHRGSGMPILAATVISRASLENILERRILLALAVHDVLEL